MLFVCLSSTVATLLGFCVMQGGGDLLAHLLDRNKSAVFEREKL
jgi:hypothetical protein